MLIYMCLLKCGFMVCNLKNYVWLNLGLFLKVIEVGKFDVKKEIMEEIFVVSGVICCVKDGV